MKKRLTILTLFVSLCSLVFGQQHWTLDPSVDIDVATNMSLISTVKVSGELQTSEQLELAAFKEGKVRGSVMLKHTSIKNGSQTIIDGYFAYLQIFGEEGDSFTFKLYDKTTQKEYVLSNTIVDFDESNSYNEFNPFVVEFIGGEGTATAPYLINGLADLKAFRDVVNAGDNFSGKYVKLNADIDLNNEDWTPIGYMGKTFKGNFDGGSKTIKNLKITKTLENASNNNGIGLFGRTDSPATIKDFTIENVDITGSLYVGAVVGYGYTGKLVEKVTVKGNIAIDAWWYAGVIGGNGYMNLVNDCHVIGNDGSYIKGNNGSYIGGIWGFRGEGANNITNCTVTNLDIQGVDKVGGICGIGHYGNTISGCSAEDVTITATDPEATTIGLIVGATQGTVNEPTTIKDNELESTTARIDNGDGTYTEVTTIYGTNIDGTTPITNYVANIGTVYYEDLVTAFKAATSGCTIELLKDVTISSDWDCRNTGAKFTVPVTINGNGNTIKFTGAVSDGGNYHSVFRFQAAATVKNLKFDLSEASGYSNRVRAISSSADLTVDKCVFVGNTNLTNTRAIIFGEGAGANVGNLAISITNSTFKNWKRGIGDNENAQDVKSVAITGNTFEKANVSVSAYETITFTGNTTDSDVQITSYTENNELDVTATGNTLAGGTYTINAGGTVVQEGFQTPVAEINGKGYFTLQSAIDKVTNGQTIKLLANVDEDVTVVQSENKAFTIDGDQKTMSGTITVDGKSAAYATACLTVKNVKFDATNISKDASINLGGTNATRYTSNVTIEGCTFTGTGKAKVGVKNYTGGCKNVTIKNCTATGLHSLAQLKTSTVVTLANNTVTECKNGVSLGSSTDVTVTECTINVDGYGIRPDGGSSVTVTDSKINAFIPVVVRYASAEASLTFNGTNTMDASNTDGIWCAIGTTEYEENGNLPTAPTSEVTVVLNDTSLSYDGVYADVDARVGNKYYKTFADAIEAAQEGETITMLAPIVVAAGETLEIDLAGRTIEYTSSVAGEDMITNKGTLTINDSSNPSTGKITYNNTDTNGSNVTVSTISNEPGGTLTINGGTIENTSSNANAFTGKIFPFTIDNLTNGTLSTAKTVINGGTIKSNYRSIRLFANSTSDRNTVNINGGEMIGQVWLQAASAKEHKVTLTISDGKFAPQGNDASSVYVTTLNTTKPTFRVTGGYFTTKIGTDNATLACNYGIAGGTFTAEAMQNTPAGLIRSGYEFMENADGTYGVATIKYVSVTDANGNVTEYASIDEASRALTDGATITLLKDVTKGISIDGKSVTLDLAGKTMSQSGAAIFVENGGSLTITDSSAEKTGKINATGDVITVKNSTVVINGGSLESTGGDVIAMSYSTVTVNGGNLTAAGNGISMTANSESEPNVLTITDGEIVAGSYAIAGNGTYDYSTITISGGKISGTEGGIYHSPEGTLAISGGEISSLNIKAGKDVTISGGKITGETVVDYQGTNSGYGDINIAITGGKFGGAVTSTAADGLEAKTGFISGGTFDNPVAEEHCKEGYIPEDNGDGTYGVKEGAYVAQIGTTKYESLAKAFAAAAQTEELTTIQLLPVTIEEDDDTNTEEKTIKLPATIKNVIVKGADNNTSILKNLTIQSAQGGTYDMSNITFDGVVFDNSNIVLTGWRTGFESLKNLTIKNCTFKNIVRSSVNLAAVHINVAADKAVNGFTFTNNIINGVTGAQNSGIYGQFTGEVIVKDNTINNVAFRPYVIQLTTDDGIADTFTVTGNTFSGSAVGRAQALGNNAEGTDDVVLTVSNNIFKGITDAQQICYWNFNAEKTTADLSKNYYDIDILANPNKIYYNSAAQNAEDLIEMGVYPYYKDEAKTELVEQPSIMVTYPVGNPVYADGKIEYYEDMLEAVPYTTNCPRLEGATITLLKDVSGAGMRFMENDMVFDLNGHTYTITQGTGSQGTNTSGFQIRPEVTTDVLFKDGTIKVAEGAPVTWMFNCYATDFIIENVTVDCTNMAWSYGTNCYVVVSRAEDNVQFLGETKIENFNSDDAGVAYSVGGTMTVAETVSAPGTFQLGAGAQLTAKEGLDVVSADGCYLIYNNGVYTSYSTIANVATKAELNAALANANITTIVMSADIDYGTDQLKIEKPITLDLGGFTLTTRNAWGGMSIKNNPTVKNGTIVHASNTAAIKVWNATAFEDLVIEVQGKGDANKTIGGIVLQSGSTTRVGSIKNVTIKGDALTNGIETYNCGDATENVIGSMENVNIDANGTGMLISAPCGTATNCSISGDVNGIEIWIKGNYSASLDLVSSKVEGGVYAHDEFNSNPNIVNDGTLNFTADEATTGAKAEDVTLTIARAEVEQVKGVLNDVMTQAQAKVNDTYYLVLADAMTAAKTDDVVTVFEGTYTMPSMKAGITIVGDGEVMFEGTLTGNLENLTMKNIHIKGDNAQRWAYAKGNLVFDNVTFEATSVYALHFDGITEGTSLTYKDCTIIGWVALGGSPASCTFNGCTIKGNGSYGVIRTYFDATIENCIFDVANVNTTDIYQDGIHAVEGAEVIVNNCTNVNGDMKDIVNVSGISVVVLDGVKIKNVAKVGDSYYWTLAEAINAAQEGQTVKVIDNIELTETLTVAAGKVVTLDLNGKTVSYTSTIQGESMITNNGNLTITDLSEAKEGKIAYIYAGAADTNYAKGNYTFSNAGTLTIENGEVTVVAKDHTGKFSHALYAIHTSGNLVINGGKVLNNNNNAIRQWAGSATNSSNITINGGEIVGLRAIWLHLPNNNTALAPLANITVTGGILTGTAIDGTQDSGNELAIYSYSYGNDMKNVAINISGGTFNGDIALTGGTNKTNIETLNITGGTFNGKKGDVYSYGADEKAVSAITIKGGSFSSNEAEKYALDNGYVFVQNQDGSYGVQELPTDATIEIEDINELIAFRNAVNAGNTFEGKTVVLTGSIDLNPSRAINYWTPIGTTANPFKGTFDGGNNVISNLVVEGENYVGLFGYADNATIKNVKIENATVIGTDCVGAIAGNVYSESLIDNCHVSGSIKVKGQTNVGGIVGKYYTKVTNCSVIGDGVATSYVKGVYVAPDYEGDNIGGIMGHAGENNTHSGNTVKNITISGTRKVGGLIGVTDQNTDIANCLVENVNIETTATAEYATANKAKAGHASIVGSYTKLGTNNNGTVNNCVVKKVNFLNPNNVEVSFGPITGGAREGMIEPTGVTASGNLIYMSSITGEMNNYYLMNAVAKIGETKYYTLQEAVTAAGTNATTIDVIANTTENITIAENADITVAFAENVTLNGYIAPFKANLTINGGIINNTNSNYSALEINAGTLKLNDVNISSSRHAVRIDGAVTATINGGEYRCGTITGTRHAVNVSGAANVTIVDGTFVGPKGTVADSGSAVKVQTGAIVIIEGGDFSKGKNSTLSTDGTLLVKGGTFDQNTVYNGGDKPIENFLEAGYVCQMNTDGKYEVFFAVASVTDAEGTTYYTSFAEAFATANGKTLTLLTDIELSEMLTVPAGKTVTLDLNGKTITGIDNTTKNFSLIDNRGTLTITDNTESKEGKMTLTATVNSGWGRYSAVVANNPGGKLVIENGTLEHLGGTDMTYGIDNLTNGKNTYAETIINGGTIKSTYRAVRQFLNGVEAQNILTINGGTLEGDNKSIFFHDPSTKANTGTLTVGEGATLKGDVYLFVTAGSTEWPVEVSIAAVALSDGSEIVTGNVPAGYDVQLVNGVYGVFSGVAKIGTTYYATLAQALNAAQEGETVQMLKDVELEATTTISEGITLDGNNHKLTAKTTVPGNNINAITVTAAQGKTVTLKNLDIECTGFGVGSTTAGIYNFSGKNDLVLDNVKVLSSSYGIYSSTSKIVVNNSTVKGDMFAIYSTSKAEISLNESTLEKTNNYGAGSAIYVQMKGSKLNVVKSNITAYAPSTNIVTAIEIADNNVVVNIDANSTITVTGSNVYVIYVGDKMYNSKTITNGTYTIAGGAGITKPSVMIPNIYIKDAQAQIVFDDKAPIMHFTLAEALADVNGNNVQILKSVVLTEDTELNLNDKVVVTNPNIYPVIRIQNGANVTITGEGSITNNDYVFVLGASDQSSAGNLTIENGKFHGATTVASVTKGNLVITGGEFSADPYNGGYDFLINCYDANYANETATVAISGGMFHNWNPQDNAAETGGHTNFCADGFGAKETSTGVWTVLPMQTRQLANGWNWFSYYVDTDLETLETALGTSGIEIKNHSTFVRYTNYPEYNYAEWAGSLNMLSADQMYMVRTSADVNVELVGSLVDHTEVEITLNPGWNWIGFPMNSNVSIEDALSGLTPNDGDVIKSHDVYAQYTYFEDYNIGVWATGSLTTLTPGEGFMYRNTSSETKTFTYSPSLSKSEVKANVTAENNYWTPNASQYPFNMIMTAMLDVEGGDYEVAAFVNGEVRGSARPIYVEALDSYMLFLTIHGEDVEEMTFKYYDLTTGEEFDLNDRMNYSNDAIVGSVKEPYMFTRGTTGIGESSMSEVNIYPNPTTTGTEINLQATCDKVEVFNALGVKVAEYQNVDTIDAIETAGVYVIRITNNSNVQNCRLVVR